MLLDKLKRLLASDESVGVSDPGIRQAVAALLIHASRIDDDVDPAEIAARDRLLKQKFDATAEGLKDKILGVQVSTVHATYAKKHFGDSVAEIKEYQTQDEANQDLAAGRIDATQADSIALDAFLESDAGKACCDLKGHVAPDVEVLGPGVGVGLRKGDTALMEKINAAIKAIRANGKYAEITKKYFDFDIYGEDSQTN